MRNLLLTFVMAFTGCGMDFEQEKEAECKEGKEESCELEEGGAESETAEREEAQGELKPLAKLDPKDGTTVNVEVNVNVNTGQPEEPENIPFRIAAKRMNWAEAVSNAPNGYHIPTKQELAQILADYDLSFEGYDEDMESPKMVWTFSKSGEVQSWAMDLKDGSPHSYDRMVYLEVIYVGDQNAD